MSKLRVVPRVKTPAFRLFRPKHPFRCIHGSFKQRLLESCAPITLHTTAVHTQRHKASPPIRHMAGGYTVKPTPCVSQRNTSTSQHGPVFRIRQCFTRISHSRSSRSAHGPTVGLSTCGRPFPSIRYALTTKFRPLIPSMTRNSAKSRAQPLPSFSSPYDIPAATGTNSSMTSDMQRNTTRQRRA